MSSLVEELSERRSSTRRGSDDIHLRVIGKSISPTTYLATDYLNHFNEVIMLLDMIVDMPDLIDELREWQPKDYVTHFAESGLSDQDLIVEAYHAALSDDRDTLYAITSEMERIIQDTIKATMKADMQLDEISLTMLCSSTTEKLRERINLASGVINSGAASVAQHHDTSLTHTSINDTQETVDILFD
ncbi:MAG: hypothetical protein COB13_006020 [OCS116 cluster bacterium]|uniref:Chemotaxis protein n=1 Tax=OCS116 cluster bacterium TaxID=2030921 RepID=A0A2A4Z8W9_9PROT|nr:hypothetical protein [OCS116 cluster bacterium]